FFNLGGHSLLLAELATRLQERTGREVPLLELFRHTTVAAQAAWLDGGGQSDAASATPERGRASARLAARARSAGPLTPS
ncbi:MAG TPA: acyl carrier protein, partial [Longimicrobium sp.]|nr:acyl carrier protein [Longimicrobium sp.]